MARLIVGDDQTIGHGFSGIFAGNMTTDSAACFFQLDIYVTHLSAFYLNYLACQVFKVVTAAVICGGKGRIHGQGDQLIASRQKSGESKTTVKLHISVT